MPSTASKKEALEATGGVVDDDWEANLGGGDDEWPIPEVGSGELERVGFGTVEEQDDDDDDVGGGVAIDV